MIRTTPTGVEIDVRVVARSRKEEIDGMRGDALLVRVTAAPFDGAANEALVDVLARRLGVTRRAVQIVAGAHARRKRIALDGVTADDVCEKLGM